MFRNYPGIIPSNDEARLGKTPLYPALYGRYGYVVRIKIAITVSFQKF